MALVKVPENREAEMLQIFCDNSMFTLEGVDMSEPKKLAKELEKFFRSCGYGKKDFLAYWFDGSVMNKHYSLSGYNAYRDDLRFIIIPDFYDPRIKSAIGARWFDDIVANNSIRQHAINTGLEPDYN